MSDDDHDAGARAERVVVVTGGAGGIGGGITRRMADAGDHVILNDIDEDAAARLAGELASAGRTVTVVAGDVTADEVVERIASTAEAVAGGGIDVLVNNVGDYRPATPIFLRSTREQWTKLHELNLLHVFAMSYRLLPAMIERHDGSIINISTVEAYRGIPGSAVYSAYKAGVSAFTKSLAVEVAGLGIRVNAIAPDLANTEQTPAAAMLNGRDPELIRSWVPLGRFGEPDDYAAVVEFLASDGARFVTGHTIPVDGGTLSASGWYGRSKRRGWTNLPDGA